MIEEQILKFRQKRLTNQEIQTLLQLVNKYGDNYEQISVEMRDIFGKSKGFRPRDCKHQWEKYSNIYKWNLMGEVEFQEVYKNFKLALTSRRRRIWRKMSRLFLDRTAESLNINFYSTLKHIYRDLISLLAKDEQKPFYIQRITRMNQVSHMTLVYFSDYEMTQFEKNDQVFADIVQACKKFIKWLELLIEIGFLHKVDFRSLLQNNILQQLPSIDTSEVDQTLELLLVLDTLNRVIFSAAPYTDQYSRSQPKVNRKSFTDSSNEELEIQERPQYFPNEISRLKVNRVSNPEYYQDRSIPYTRMKFYYKLSGKQRDLLLNSQTVNRLITISTKLDQLST